MRRLKNIAGVLLILAAFAGLVLLLLHWKPLDEFLTSKIGETRVSEERSNILIRISGWDELLPEAQRPYVYSQNGALYCVTAKGDIDITPPGDISKVFYSSESGAAEKIRYRHHAALSSSGGLMLFVVEVHDVRQLYLTDFYAETTELVCENVDSFMFIGDEPVYATGYSTYNKLYVYRNGETVPLAANATYLPVPELGGIIYLDLTGRVFYRNVSGGDSVILGENIGSMYSYFVSSGGLLTFWGVSGDNYLRCICDPSTGKVTRYVEDNEPTFAFSCAGGDYTFSSKTGKLIYLPSVLDPENGVQLFKDSGFIYKIFSAEENRVLFATKKGIFEGTVNGSAGTAVRLLSFTGDRKMYARYPWLAAEHMQLERCGDGFYMLSLSVESSIINKRNPYSWMNRYSSFVYKLTYIGPEKDGERKIADCDAPLSRKLILPRRIDAEHALFESCYAGGQVKALTVMRGGETLLRDAMRSEGESRGTRELTAEIAEGNVLIINRCNIGTSSEHTERSLLRDDFRATVNAGSVYAVSFGRFYVRSETE